MLTPGQEALWKPRPRFLSGTSIQRYHWTWPDDPMTSLAEALGLVECVLAAMACSGVLDCFLNPWAP
jgi:hypothetical protein